MNAQTLELEIPEPVAPTGTFTNPLYRGADPWVIRDNGFYYYCQASHGGIEVWKSPTLLDKGRRHVVWRARPYSWNSCELWAPELHRIGGRWYIYYAASNGFNASHRMGVLSSASDDPTDRFVDDGMLYTGDCIETRRLCRWAIDGTILNLHGNLYFIWSGWPDERDLQHLYIAQMSDPRTIASNRVRLCGDDSYLWERVGERDDQRALREAPQVLVRNGRVFLVYSCSGSWQPTYKLGMLHMSADDDPMDAASWTKACRPVFASANGIFGVGHCCFTTSPDGREDWIVYHAQRCRFSGWDRVVRAQRFVWTEDGVPDFGSPIDGPVAVPGGDSACVRRAGMLTRPVAAPGLAEHALNGQCGRAVA